MEPRLPREAVGFTRHARGHGLDHAATGRPIRRTATTAPAPSPVGCKASSLPAVLPAGLKAPSRNQQNQRPRGKKRKAEEPKNTNKEATWSTAPPGFAPVFFSLPCFQFNTPPLLLSKCHLAQHGSCCLKAVIIQGTNTSIGARIQAATAREHRSGDAAGSATTQAASPGGEGSVPVPPRDASATPPHATLCPQGHPSQPHSLPRQRPPPLRARGAPRRAHSPRGMPLPRTEELVLKPHKPAGSRLVSPIPVSRWFLLSSVPLPGAKGQLHPGAGPAAELPPSKPRPSPPPPNLAPREWGARTLPTPKSFPRC